VDEYGLPEITLDAYAHLMAKSQTRMRTLIDRALGMAHNAPDVPSRTGQARWIQVYRPLLEKCW
jgi:hypothetical protein